MHRDRPATLHTDAVTPWLWLGVVLVSSAGVGVTGYLTNNHFSGGQLACFGGGGCEQVQASRFALLYGVPVALLGLGFYLTSLFLGVIGLLHRPGLARSAAPVLFVLTLTAGLFSLYLTGLQMVVLHSFCSWCLTSAGLSAALLGLSVSLVWRWQGA